MFMSALRAGNVSGTDEPSAVIKREWQEQILREQSNKKKGDLQALKLTCRLIPPDTYQGIRPMDSA